MIDISSKLNTIIENDNISSITAFLYLLNEKEIIKYDEQFWAYVSKPDVPIKSE